MSYKIPISEKAITDFTRAKEYYKRYDVSTKQKFKLEFKKIVTRLKETPEIFQEIETNQRRAILSASFPYSIHYFINTKEKIVEIVGVIHQSKNLDLVQQEIKLEKLHGIRRKKSQRLKQREMQLKQLRKSNEQEKDRGIDQSIF